MADIWAIAEKTIKGAPYRVQPLGSGNASDIMRAVLSCQESAQEQTRYFASCLARIYKTNYKRLLYDLYTAVCKNVRLQYDPTGEQLIRKPSNIVIERACDCKSYSLLISSVLSNLGIKNAFRFVSFAPDKEVTHVYVVAFPGTQKQVVLDCNLRNYGEETNYYKKIDKMARISAIGKVKNSEQNNKSAWRSGRSLATMSEPELALHLHISELKSELNLPQVKYNSLLSKQKRAQIEYEGDLLKTVQAATDKGGAYIDNYNQLIGAIEKDWVRGRYFSMPRSEMLRRRAQEWQNGTRYHSESKIGSLKSFFKKVGKGIKTVANTVGTAVVKTVKATGEAIVSSAKLAANVTKMATIAPIAALSEKGREEIKKTAQNIKENVIEQGQAIKTVTLAPVSSLVEEVFDEMREAGPYFFYYYVIPEDKLQLFPQKVQYKWAKQKESYDRIIKYLDVDKSKLNSVIRESIIRQWGHTPEEVLKSLVLVRTKGNSTNDPSQVGELVTASVTAVASLVSAIAAAASAIVLLILKIIGAVKNKSEVEDGAAQTADWIGTAANILGAASGSTDSEGNFNLNDFSQKLLTAVGKSNTDKTTTYANLISSLSGMLNKGESADNTEFYNNMIKQLQAAATTAGGTSQKVTDTDLYKFISAMAEKDGIGTEWETIKSKISNLDDLGAAYASALTDKYAIEQYLQLSNIKTPEASKLDNLVSSSSESGTAATPVASSAGTSTAKTSIWPIVIGAGVLGALMLSSKKKKKKNNKK